MQTPAPVPIPIEELGITPHKQRILRMRLEGYTPRQIAHLLQISEKTVHNHIAQIFAQHDVNNLVDFTTKVGWLRVISNTSQPIEYKAELVLTMAATA